MSGKPIDEAVRALPARWRTHKRGLSALGCANELERTLTAAQQQGQAELPPSEYVGATAKVRDCNCQRYNGRDCRKCFNPPYPNTQPMQQGQAQGGCMCDPTGADGQACPDATGTPLCYTAPPSAPVGVEWLCRVYADAYHAGHRATVEGNYVDVLPVDRDTYWREKVEEDYPEALAQQPAAVDESFVERFCGRWFQLTGRSLDRPSVRACLTEALATQHQEPKS